MYDDVANLISYDHTGRDKYGNLKTTEKKTAVYVQPRGVYSSEFYSASQLGLKPSITFRLANRADYSEQPVIEFKNVLYNVIRVDWNAQRDSVDLICERRVSNGRKSDSSDGKDSE